MVQCRVKLHSQRRYLALGSSSPASTSARLASAVRSHRSGKDPVALLIYDRAGHFAAQFMKRDRSVVIPDGPSGATNNSRAQGGYDAYFGTYTVDDAASTVTQRLLGALSQENVDSILTREMEVRGDTLVIRVQTSAADGTAVTRTLTWNRVG